jgi:hypothetical protein
MNCRDRGLGGSNLSADLLSHLQVFFAQAGATPDRKLEVSSPQARSGRERAQISPDEIATLIALDERARKVADVKAVFPGAEIVGTSADPAELREGD